VVGAAFAAILMVVGNTMMMIVRERAREIGVLKTLGFSSARVLRLVLGETVLLAIVGGLPGLAVAAAVTLMLRRSLVQFVPGMTLNPSIILTGLGFMLVLGLATGLLPAINAWRLKIAVAMGRG